MFQTSFLTLPAELRLRVYQDFFHRLAREDDNGKGTITIRLATKIHAAEGCWPYYDAAYSSTWKEAFGLLQVSKQIRTEAVSEFAPLLQIIPCTICSYKHWTKRECHGLQYRGSFDRSSNKPNTFSMPAIVSQHATRVLDFIFLYQTLLEYTRMLPAAKEFELIAPNLELTSPPSIPFRTEQDLQDLSQGRYDAQLIKESWNSRKKSHDGTGPGDCGCLMCEHCQGIEPAATQAESNTQLTPRPRRVLTDTYITLSNENNGRSATYAFRITFDVRTLRCVARHWRFDGAEADKSDASQSWKRHRWRWVDARDVVLFRCKVDDRIWMYDVPGDVAQMIPIQWRYGEPPDADLSSNQMCVLKGEALQLWTGT